MFRKFATLVAILPAAILVPAACLADNLYGDGWGMWPASYFPARVTALLYDDYRTIDSKHSLTFGGWTILMRSSAPAHIIGPACTHTPGLHEGCGTKIAGLWCRRGSTRPLPCSMPMDYSYWVGEYDCTLRIGARSIELHACPEIAAEANGKLIGPAVQPLPASAPRARAVVFRNATSRAIGGIVVLFWRPKEGTIAVPVPLAQPLAPGKHVKATLPRSVFTGNGRGGETVRLVYIGDRCKSYGVEAMYAGEPVVGKSVNEWVIDADLCAPGGVTIVEKKDPPRRVRGHAKPTRSPNPVLERSS